MTEYPAASIARRITNDGAIVTPKLARYFLNLTGMTADRLSRLFFTDIEAYEVLSALRFVARSDFGTNQAGPQANSTDLSMWMSTSEAAAAAGVTDRCIRKWCEAGQLDVLGQDVGSRRVGLM